MRGCGCGFSDSFDLAKLSVDKCRGDFHIKMTGMPVGHFQKTPHKAPESRIRAWLNTLKGTAIILTVIILDFRTLSVTGLQILTS